MIVESDENGKITSIIYGCDENFDFYQDAILIENAEISWKTHYILNGQPTERPASPVTLSNLTLQGVPTGSTLTINGERFEGVEGNVELEFPLPGVYSLRVECFPYKDWEGEVTV